MDIEQTPDILADAGFFYTGILICSSKILNRIKPLLIKITVNRFYIGAVSRLVFYKRLLPVLTVCFLSGYSSLPIYSTFNDKNVDIKFSALGAPFGTNHIRHAQNRKIGKLSNQINDSNRSAKIGLTEKNFF